MPNKVGGKAIYEGSVALIETLRRIGIIHYCGVNGGGIIHVTKYLEPLTDLSEVGDGVPRMLTLAEYAAGFVPIGYYLASGRIACSISTTGAAAKLAGCGLSDAKLHNIPAVYLIALNSKSSIGKAPIQDVSEYGINIVKQLTAELNDGCIVVDDSTQLEKKLLQMQKILRQSRPVAIAFHPDVLCTQQELKIPIHQEEQKLDIESINKFISEFPSLAKNRRVVLYVGEEAAFCPNIQPLISEFANLLKAPVIWSINGANAIDPACPLNYGYILFGGNDKAIKLWQSINVEDIVITLGFCPGEYSINLEQIPAKYVWHIGAYQQGYGQVNGSFKHRCAGDYFRLRVNIADFLTAVIPKLQALGISADRPTIEVVTDLNERNINRNVLTGCVDLYDFYQRISQLWRAPSIGFDDVCVAYKDRQYVTQRPHPNIKFWALHHGSAMGGAFGLGVGAKMANPALHTFVFTGDGCWRLFAGCLADVAHFGLRVFVMNNGTYAIVDKGLEVIIPNVAKRNYHSKMLNSIDFVAAAKANGWLTYRLQPDLSNLQEIMEICYTTSQSILVDVPVDPDQVVGINYRLRNLTTQFYL